MCPIDEQPFNKMIISKKILFFAFILLDFDVLKIQFLSMEEKRNSVRWNLTLFSDWNFDFANIVLQFR